MSNWRFTPITTTLRKFLTQWLTKLEERTALPMTIERLFELRALVYEPISTFSLPHCWREGHPV